MVPASRCHWVVSGHCMHVLAVNGDTIHSILCSHAPVIHQCLTFLQYIDSIRLHDLISRLCMWLAFMEGMTAS
jgi:hypothetical protein